MHSEREIDEWRTRSLYIVYTKEQIKFLYSVHYYRNRALSREYISDWERERDNREGEWRIKSLCLFIIDSLHASHYAASSTLASRQLQRSSFINTYIHPRWFYPLNINECILFAVKRKSCLYALCVVAVCVSRWIIECISGISFCWHKVQTTGDVQNKHNWPQ